MGQMYRDAVEALEDDELRHQLEKEAIEAKIDDRREELERELRRRKSEATTESSEIT